MKNSPIIITFINVILSLSCTDNSHLSTPDPVAKTSLAIERHFACTGSLSESCAALGSSESACDQLLIDCQWINGTCIPETDCDTYTISEDCAFATSYTSPIISCEWNEIPTCYGSISEACRNWGPTQTDCESIASISCQWYFGACIPASDCGTNDHQESCEQVQSTTTPYQTCTWGIPPYDPFVCTGSITEACAVGTSETNCNALTIDCQWVNGACVPEMDCPQLENETACLTVAENALPVTSCTWHVRDGHCTGQAYSVGEGQCQNSTDQENCEITGLLDGNGAPLFPASLCVWLNGSCHVKDTICTEQTTSDLCFTASDRSYNFGLCEWIWE